MFTRVATALTVFLFSAADALAERRFTDVSGREVTISRGPSRVSAASRLIVQPLATNIVNAGPNIDDANNDFRRIQNAINVAASGDTIILNGTFDFTHPVAAAAWALGNDNVASSPDDFSVSVPANRNNITLTASALGNATIQGPGDLAAQNLEGFLVFDGGDNQGWTISNLRILDFDLAIGMFAGAGGTDAFNSTTIQNNFIRIPRDLNAIAAPSDANQNIGIHYSFGTSQSILNNTFHVLGDGVSDAVSVASTVAMQSNVSGGSVYDGLSITGNQIHVLNAQSANPERIIGIWDNAHGHSSNIVISANHFINDGAGNNSAINLQIGFRVTSHSSATTRVAYNGNSVSGANIGFEWMNGINFAGNQAVRLTTNTIIGCRTGVLVQANGAANINQNIITGSGAGGGIRVMSGSLTAAGAIVDAVYQSSVSGGSGDGIWIGALAGTIGTISQNDLSGNAGFGLRNDAAPSVTAERNWWGSNLTADLVGELNGTVDFDPWLASGTDVSGAFAFQPFLHATTSGALTTFAGTAGADTGSFLAGDPVTMIMNAETAFTPRAQFLNLAIQLAAQNDVFTLGALPIPTTFDGGAGNDTLVASDIATDWSITGAGAGTIAGAAFTGVESLRGGNLSDSFVFAAAGTLAQTIDGNLGSDTLDNSAIPASNMNVSGPGTLDGFKGTATGIAAGFDNIDVLITRPADVAVTKTGPATVAAGGTISYTITVTNNGPANATGVTLEDVLPAGTTFVSLALPGTWSCTVQAGTINCNRATAPPGSDVLTLILEVNSAPDTPGSVTNSATIDAMNDNTPGNNSATAVTSVQMPNPVLTSLLPTRGSTKGDTPLTLTGSNFQNGLTVTIGGVTASDVVVVDATSITVTTPAHPRGLVDVVVTNPNGQAATLANGYRYGLFDPSGDNEVTVIDVFHLINHLFFGGPLPEASSGDANGDGLVDAADVFYVLQFLFGGGPEPA